MKTVSNLKKELYSRSLADKIAKDTAQFNLRKAYKPLLEGQKETSEAQMRQQQNLQDARSRDLTQKHEQLISEIKTQPFVIPLIKSLNNSPKIIDVIKGKSDGSDLSGKEQHILKQLNDVDDRVLRTLIEHNSVSGPDDESGIETMLSRESANDEAGDMFDAIMRMKDNANKEETKQALKELFEEQENKDKYLRYLEAIHYQFDLSKYSYTTIKTVNHNLYAEIKELRKLKTNTGCRVNFLSTDPNELFNKLQILIAEKEAGNNNVLNEASAITDELRRQGHLSIAEVKKIYELIAK